MSESRPNVILLLRLKPEDLARETLRSILAEVGAQPTDFNQLEIGGNYYTLSVMESDYDEDNQIAADEGDIIVYNLVTYGYGDVAPWEYLCAQKAALDVWAAGVCERHHCTASVFVTANYW